MEVHKQLVLCANDGLKIKVDNGVISKKGKCPKNIRHYYILRAIDGVTLSCNAVNKKATKD